MNQQNSHLRTSHLGEKPTYGGQMLGNHREIKLLGNIVLTFEAGDSTSPLPDMGRFIKPTGLDAVARFHELNAYRQIERANMLKEKTGWSLPLLSKKRLAKNNKDIRETAIGVLLNSFHDWAESKLDVEVAVQTVIPLLDEFRGLKPSPKQLNLVKDIIKTSEWPICLGLVYKNGCNRENCTYIHSASEAETPDDDFEEKSIPNVPNKMSKSKPAALPDFIKGRNHKGVELDEISHVFEFFHDSGFSFYFTPANVMNFPDSRDMNVALEMMEVGGMHRPGLVVHGSFKFSDLPVLHLGGERSVILCHDEMEEIRLLPHLVSDCGRVVVVRDYMPGPLLDWTSKFCNYSTNVTNLFSRELFRDTDTRTRVMMKYTSEILMKLSIEGAQFSRKAVYNRLYSLMKSRHGADVDDPARIFSWISSEEYLSLVKDTINLGREQLPKRLENTVRSKLATALKSYETTHWWMQLKAATSLVSCGLAMAAPLALGSYIHLFSMVSGAAYLKYVPHAILAATGALTASLYNQVSRSYDLLTSEATRNHSLLANSACEPLKVSLLSKGYLQRQKCRNAKLDKATQTLEKNVLRYDIDEREDDEYVEMYGTTIRGANVVIPSKDLEELKAANIIRMGTKRQYNKKVFKRFKKFVKSMFEDFGSHDVDMLSTLDYLVKQYGAKRAERMIKLYGVPYEDFLDMCKEIVKDEAYCGKDPDNYKPRMIWTRDEWFVVNFGPWFYSIGNLVKDFVSKNGKYSSGCTPADVGAQGEKIDSFDNIFECDVSNWDGSLHGEFLDIELMFIEHCVDSRPDQWEELQSRWKKVHGEAKSGQGFVRMLLDRARRSGDLWTSAFNSLINYCIVMFALGKDRNSTDVYYMVLGDDGIGGVNDKLCAKRITAVYQLLGMEVEFISRDSIFDATYCSGYFYPVGGRVIWGNMPFRQFSKFGINFGNHPTRKHKGLLYGTSKGMLCSAGHVPIFGSFLRAIADSAEREGVKEIRDNRHENPYRHQGGVVLYPEMDTYLWFADKYQISVQQIFRIEELMESCININMFPLVFEEELFLSCFRVDCGLELDHPENDLHFMDDYELLKDAYDEEVEKLRMSEEMGVSAYAAGLIFGQDESKLPGAAFYAPQAHAFLSWVSSYNLWLGTILHYWHNKVAVLCTLNKKKKNKPKPPQKKPAKKGPKKAPWKTAVGNLLKAGGGALGTYLGGPVGGQVGGVIGNGIAKITGMGDYKIHSNSLITEAMTFGDGGFTIRHREFISNVYSSIDFSTVSYSINPGLSTTFPWLAILAEAYQRYDIKGLVFEFVSTAGYLTTTQAQGVLVMATQYDPTAAPFVNRREMESYLYTTSGIVTETQTHFVECNPKDRPLEDMYVRYGTDSSDHRFTDLGTFTLGVQGCPEDDVVLGELWVTYDVQLQLPRLTPHGYGSASWAHVANGAYTNTEIFGSIQTTPIGNLEIEISALGGGYDTVSFPSELDYGYYLVTVAWKGSQTSPLALSQTAVNAEFSTAWQLDTQRSATNTGALAAGGTLVWSAVFNITGKNSYFTLSSATLPTSGTSVDLFIAQIQDPNYESSDEFKSYEDALQARGVIVRHPTKEAPIRKAHILAHETSHSREAINFEDDLKEYEEWKARWRKT